MRIIVRSAAHLAKIMGGRLIYTEMPEPSTLLDLLHTLSDTYGQEFYDAVCDGEGYVPRKVAILVNGSSAIAIGGVGISLKDEDDVLILPAISGG